ncbi:MAG: arylsulfatase [Deltaproteobacteria bacterium]|nr:arylsulfatase [Deltaproteobacteria bacterium]
MRNRHRRTSLVSALVFCALVVAAAAPAAAQEKPNILVIFGDDVGMWNISAYHRGMMGGSTPNIDRIANEGALFTDYYSQQSCTAGRAAFIMGQHPFRTGLLTIGMPGAKEGISELDPTIADLLKNHGYMTAQHGKNHLGDQDEHLPTNHGFDEFFGNLYHLNAEEEPETDHCPKDPEFHHKFGPRGVIKSAADGKIEDTGPLTRKRMETIDEVFLGATLDFMERADKAEKPFFIWHNSTRMHVWTRLKAASQGRTGYGLYADGMAELDDQVGQLLAKLDELGIADNTIVVFSTDNGAETMSWPDGGTIPFRGEKGTTWEGGFRSPAMVRWPGVVKPGTIVNDIFSGEDWMPTLLAAAGEPDVKEKLLKGHTANGKTFKVHLDGYDQTDVLSGKGPGKRHEIFYFDAGGNLNAIRYNDWKLHFTIMEGDLTEAYRKSPSWPVVFNLRMSPFEKPYSESRMYLRWMADQMWMFVPAQHVLAKFIGSFEEYPQRQPIGSLSVDAVMKKMATGGGKN